MENNNNNDNLKLQGREEGYTGQTDINSDKNKKKMATGTKVRIGVCGTGCPCRMVGRFL